MLIHSNVEENSENPESIDFDNLCSICYDPIKEDDEISTLSCNHRYHYQCIYLIYKSMPPNKRQCPYCRADGGYLKLLPGKKPLKGIHAEYYIDNYEIQYIPGKCKYILKRGKNSGSQCSFNIKNSSGYCTRHHKLLESKNQISEIES
jgi:hypothetical protein